MYICIENFLKKIAMLKILEEKATQGSVAVVNTLKAILEKSVPYKGKVYLGGETIIDMILGRPISTMKILVDVPKGGIGFTTWVAAMTGDLAFTASAITIDAKTCSSTLRLRANPDHCGIMLNCRYTRKNCSADGSSIPVFMHGNINDEVKTCSCTATSLMYDITNDCMVDITGKGMDDIRRGIIRSVGDAHKFIERDPERIFTILTLQSNTGWGVEKDTWLALIKNSNRIFHMSMGDIRLAFKNLIMSRNSGDAIIALMNIGALKYICAPLNALNLHKQRNAPTSSTVLQHTAKVMNNVRPVYELKLAAMLHDIGKINSYGGNYMFHATEGKKYATSILKSMGHDEDFINRVVMIMSRHEDFAIYKSHESIPSDGHVRRFLKKCGNDLDVANLALELIHANNLAQDYGRNLTITTKVKAKIKKILENDNITSASSMVPITGDDIMKEFNLKSGRFIGEMIKKLRMMARKENRTLSKEECFEMVKTSIKEAAVD